MGWLSDNNLHEGYLAPLFTDGQRGLSVTSSAFPAGQIAVGIRSLPAVDLDYELRTAGEVVAWVVCCDCADPESPNARETWVGPTFTRVPSKALDDVSQRRLYAADVDVAYRSEDPQVDDTARALWKSEHITPIDSLAAIKTATHEVAAAQRRLNTAVHAARQSGTSWEAIGQAAGMSRQSAHERWRP